MLGDVSVGETGCRESRDATLTGCERVESGEDGPSGSPAGGDEFGVRAGIFIAAHPDIDTGGYTKSSTPATPRTATEFSGSMRTPARPWPHRATVLLTKETTALEPGVADHKYYIRGIGDVIEQTSKGGKPTSNAGVSPTTLKQVPLGPYAFATTSPTSTLSKVTKSPGA